MATVLLHTDVEKTLQQLPNDIETRIRSKLADAGENPDRHLKPLKRRAEYSLRIGKRRAIIDCVKSQSELRVLEIDTRDTVSSKKYFSRSVSSGFSSSPSSLYESQASAHPRHESVRTLR